MLYYRVKHEYDNARAMAPVPGYPGNVRYSTTVFAGELYTATELCKLCIPVAWVEEIRLPRTSTYTLFGARYAKSPETPHPGVEWDPIPESGPVLVACCGCMA